MARGVEHRLERRVVRHPRTIRREPVIVGQRRSIDAGFYALNMPEEHGGGGLGALDRALEYICRHEGVWLTTGAEIAAAGKGALG